MNLYVGTSGYSYPKWKGTFYPKDLPLRQMLRFYGERFRTVEINSTFRGLPKASVLEGWADAVPADFQFAIKAPQQITHVQRLEDAGELVSQLLQVAGVLKERRGSLLFQLPPTSKKDVPRLRAFLALLPSPHRAAFEFRHPSWFLSWRPRIGAICGCGGPTTPKRNSRHGCSGYANKTGRRCSCSSNTRMKARGHGWRSALWNGRRRLRATRVRTSGGELPLLRSPSIGRQKRAESAGSLGTVT
jgi:hypothetical protein